MEFKHTSVLLTECIEFLNIDPNGIYVDCTLGGGGHSFEIAKRLKNGKLIAIDQDDDALSAAKERLKEFEGKIIFKKSNFALLSKVLEEEKIDKVNGILFDLGVSSFQFDTGERGFSYRFSGPLDMRMGKENSLTAQRIVNEYSEDKLSDIFRKYGEEKFSRSVARRICQEREKEPIKDTLVLAEIIKTGIPAAARREGGHPAKRVFQAIRMEVNDELSVLKSALESGIEALKEDGRIAVITFHSLEDRLVKSIFTEAATGCTCPSDFPVCICGKKPKIKILTKKPVLASKEELEENNRAHSAKLRAAMKF